MQTFSLSLVVVILLAVLIIKDQFVVGLAKVKVRSKRRIDK